MNKRKQTWRAAVSAAAICVAAALPTLGETAKWINTNNGGNMSAAANWENGYIPQAGDTLDFSVITAQYKGIKQDISDDIQFETMTGFNVSLNDSNWNFRYLTSPGCEAGGLCFWGDARLNVAGKITYTGTKSFFISDTSVNSPGGVTADEFEYTGPAGKHIFRAPNKTWGGFRARTFTHNGAGYLWLSSYLNSADYTKAHYIVGSGGFIRRHAGKPGGPVLLHQPRQQLGTDGAHRSLRRLFVCRKPDPLRQHGAFDEQSMRSRTWDF